MANLDFCDKHNMVAYLQKSEGSEGFHQIVDFLNICHIKYALIENPTIYVSLIEQFWQTASASTIENRDMEITTIIDGKVKVVSEASIRRHLKLEDSYGISTLPTTEIFEQLALMGNMKRASKGYTRVDTPLFQTILVQGQILQGEGLTIPVESYHTPTVSPSTSQPHHLPTLRDFIRQETKGSGNIHKTPALPHDLPLPRVHTLGSDEGIMQPNELMELVTKLLDKVAVLENDLRQTKKTYGAAFTKLIKKMIHRDAQTQGRQEYDLEPNFKFNSPEEVYSAEPDISTANVPVSTTSAELSTIAESLVYIRRIAAKRKDKGKEAQRLQEQFDKEERQRIASVHKEASTFKPKEWDNMQAQIEADEELAHRLQAQEREGYSEADKAKLLVKLINERKRQFAQQRAQQRRNRLLTHAQQRSYMLKRVNTFTPIESDDTVPKVVAGSSKRSAEEELGEESSKRQKIGEGSEPAEESKDKESDELKYWKIIKVGDHTEVYQFFEDMLKNFDRDDLVKLWDLVREKFSSTEPTDDKERALWVELKRLFEPDTDDLLELQRYMRDPLTWRLYDTCGVHHVSTEKRLDIFMLVEKDYPMTRGLPMLMIVNKLQVDQHSKMADELLRKIFILENRPRH
ncbi:hypothetical protein Tco_0918278 [Tanacetum coccineum]